MDRDTLKLASLLCCRAGMLMEDTSVLAITVPRDEAELWKTVMELGAAIDRMRAMVDAAKALVI
jgi:hypothetical protein